MALALALALTLTLALALALVPSFLFESPLVALAATIRDANEEGWLARPGRGDNEPQRVRSSGGRCSTSDRRVRLNV